MQVGIKLGVGAAAAVLAGSALSLGAVAGATEPPPNPGQQESVPAQPQPVQPEEGQGPGAIEVGPEGAAKALARLEQRNIQRAPWCHGRVAVQQLNVRSGPGTENPVVYKVVRNQPVNTDWGRIVREDGYLWVPLSNGRWLADYKLGDGNGKWYVRYTNC
ncbi:SH3 domain-containing protein [Actinomadura sp. 3N508]|uniref:SH3 domain-containing protein n=1 Tax=Actinomadura sp. 3N508 TaxID=3375153 RepID=UPI0037AE85A3